MSDLTMRYWYTYDTTPIVTQADMCSYRSRHLACANITRTWVDRLSPARTMADFYYRSDLPPPRAT